MTPYDTALRLAERRVEKVRVAIGDAVRDLQRIEAQHIAAEQALHAEGMMAIDNPRLTTQHFFVRARNHRRQLGLERGATHARLEELRHQAVEAYGALSAMEGAVVRHHEAADHAAAAVDQAASDDLTNARYVRDASFQRRAMRIAVSAAGSPP